MMYLVAIQECYACGTFYCTLMYTNVIRVEHSMELLMSRLVFVT